MLKYADLLYSVIFRKNIRLIRFVWFVKSKNNIAWTCDWIWINAASFASVNRCLESTVRLSCIWINNKIEIKSCICQDWFNNHRVVWANVDWELYESSAFWREELFALCVRIFSMCQRQRGHRTFYIGSHLFLDHPYRALYVESGCRSVFMV